MPTCAKACVVRFSKCRTNLGNRNQGEWGYYTSSPIFPCHFSYSYFINHDNFLVLAILPAISHIMRILNVSLWLIIPCPITNSLKLYFSLFLPLSIFLRASVFSVNCHIFLSYSVYMDLLLLLPLHFCLNLYLSLPLPIIPRRYPIF